jgi:hypothetical protein
MTAILDQAVGEFRDVYVRNVRDPFFRSQSDSGSAHFAALRVDCGRKVIRIILRNSVSLCSFLASSFGNYASRSWLCIQKLDAKFVLLRSLKGSLIAVCSTGRRLRSNNRIVGPLNGNL